MTTVFFCEIVSVSENGFVGDFVVVGYIGFLVSIFGQKRFLGKNVFVSEVGYWLFPQQFLFWFVGESGCQTW